MADSFVDSKKFNAEMSKYRKQLKRSVNEYKKYHTKSEVNTYIKSLNTLINKTYAKAYKANKNKYATQAKQMEAVNKAYQFVAAKGGKAQGRKFRALAASVVKESRINADNRRFIAKANAGLLGKNPGDSRLKLTAFYVATKAIWHKPSVAKGERDRLIVERLKELGATVNIGVDNEGNPITKPVETLEDAYNATMQKQREELRAVGFGGGDIDSDPFDDLTESEFVNSFALLWR